MPVFQVTLECPSFQVQYYLPLLFLCLILNSFLIVFIWFKNQIKLILTNTINLHLHPTCNNDVFWAIRRKMLALWKEISPFCQWQVKRKCVSNNLKGFFFFCYILTNLFAILVPWTVHCEKTPNCIVYILSQLSASLNKTICQINIRVITCNHPVTQSLHLLSFWHYEKLSILYSSMSRYTDNLSPSNSYMRSWIIQSICCLSVMEGHLWEKAGLDLRVVHFCMILRQFGFYKRTCV